MDTKTEVRMRDNARTNRNSVKKASGEATATAQTRAGVAPNAPPVVNLRQTQIDLEKEVNPKWGRRLGLNVAMGLVVLGLLVGVWWLVVVLGNYPPYILPTPASVAERVWSMLLDGSLAAQFGVTVTEAGLGFLLALVVGTSLGYPVGHSRLLERVLSPYIAISQGLPVVAIAPLLFIWVQDDLTRKLIVVALIVFFPILVNTIVGLRSIDRSMYEVARISGANALQTIRYVELPLSLRPLLAGIKLGLTLSITGAVIAELIAPRSGLGFLLVQGQNLFDTTLIFVGLVSLAFLAVLVYLTVTLLERMLITWE